jgi:HK97 gp10 family phage protein
MSKGLSSIKQQFKAGNREIKRLSRKIDRETVKLAKDGIKDVLVEVGKKIVVSARASLRPHRKTGNLAASMGRKLLKFDKRTFSRTMLVGPRVSGKWRGYHGHLFEFGTVARRNRHGANRGAMPAKPFLRPAFDKHSGEVRTRMARTIKRFERSMRAP